jgi:hypothetical protein
MREVIGEYPAPPAQPRPTARVRSTIVTSGLAALRERGYIDRYTAALDPQSRDLLLTTVAGVWLPLDLVMTHYAACETLGLSHDEVFSIGMAVATRMHDNVFHLLRHLATGVGVTPWTAAARYEAFWTRAFDGGGYRLTKAGPKDGLAEYFQFPLANSAYFRSAFCGVSLAGISLFTTKAYVRVIATGKDGFTVRSSWV